MAISSCIQLTIQCCVAGSYICTSLLYTATHEVAWGRSFLETPFRSCFRTATKKEPMREIKVAGTMQSLFFFVLGFYFLATTFAVSQTAMFYIFVESCVVEYIRLSSFFYSPTNQIEIR